MCRVSVIILSMLIYHNAAVLVSVEQGQLRGEQLKTVTNDADYASFKGIPYAAPPVGDLRFRPPQPPTPWKGIRDATQHGSICTQVDFITQEYLPSSEDCLYLNVYTPNVKPPSPMAVMLFIHGGGFKSGSGNDDYYGPDFLMKYGIVLVTINYRLDALGFLNLGFNKVPGNAGMKDQVAALRWVQRNIAQFGGDPDNVTIFGTTAGAISCLLHALSPMSRGLFRRVIAMSGTPLFDISVEFESVRRGFNLGKVLGYETENATALFRFLQNVPANRLINNRPYTIIAELYINNLIKMYQFTPVAEEDFGQERFLIEDPIDSLLEGNINDVDIMIGYSNEEGLSFVFYFEQYLINVYNRFPELLCPRRFLYYLSPVAYLPSSDAIKEYYFGKRPISISTMKEFVKFQSDTYKYQSLRYMRDVSVAYANRKFLYRFSGVSERNVYSRDALKYGLIGAGQRDIEMYLLYANIYKNLTITTKSESYRIIEQLTTLFTNYAKTGNPTPESSACATSSGATWDQYDPDTQSFLDIGSVLTRGTRPEANVVSFWMNIYRRAGVPFYHVGFI